MADMIEVSLWRGKEEGRYETFQVPQRENQTVLDVVTWVQRNADPTLVLPLRLPRRHVRQLRHDRERPPALDLPHAHRRRWSRTASSRSDRSPTCR